MAGLGSFWAGLLRDCGIGRKNKRGFGIEKKSGSGFGQKIARDYGKCTKIWRDIGIKIGNGIGIKKKGRAGYDIYDKTGAGCGIGCFLSLFFLVTDGINVLLLMISQPFDEDCARIVFN